MSKLIDKLGWLHIENGKLLAARSRGKQVPYVPGGKREAGETDEQALIREIREELSIDLVPGTAQFIAAFTAQADGHAVGTEVRVTCYRAAFNGVISPAAEIEEVLWIDSRDRERCSPAGKLILDWLHERGLID
jgi:8-oxo-dGTP diphosphatase